MGKLFLSLAALVSGLTATAVVQAASGRSAGKILIVLSAESKITLRGGVVHKTGFFLNELAVPLQALIDAGYEPVIATPGGKVPVMDANSDNVVYFAGDQRAYTAAKTLVRTLPGLAHPANLSDIRKQGVDAFAGVFVPGGHAPMEDLSIDRDLGALLREFHRARKVTALICHGPIALLSALDDPADFAARLARGDKPSPGAWPYQGYRMTSFSTPEERQQEPGQDNSLGGFVRFYPDQALAAAGGRISVAGKWQSNVVRDRELITGQNPMSDGEFTRELLAALREGTNAAAGDALTVCSTAISKPPVARLAKRLQSLSGALVGLAADKRPDKVDGLYLLVQHRAEQPFDCGRALGDGKSVARVRKEASVVLSRFTGATATFFIGKAINFESQLVFERRLRTHIANTRAAFEPLGLTGYVALVGEGFEVAFMAWKSPEAMKDAFASEAGKAVVAEAGSILANVQFDSETGFQGILEPDHLYRIK